MEDASGVVGCKGIPGLIVFENGRVGKVCEKSFVEWRGAWRMLG